MALDPVAATTLTNEARKAIAKQKVDNLAGKMAALGDIAQAISTTQSDTQQRLVSAQADLATIMTGAGPGITDNFGPYSGTDQALQKERDAGKSALVDYIKANPTCTETQAVAQWKVAALAGRPVDRQWLLLDPLALRQEYSANLVAAGYVADASWSSFAAWVVATPKATILGA